MLDGIAPVPEIDAEVRETVRAMPVEQARSLLVKADPEAAARLGPADSARIARALEVVRSTGRTLAEWQKDKVGGIANKVELRPLLLLPPRPWLNERCDQRFDEIILGQGLTEVSSLLARSLPPSLPVMRAIGVAEIAAYLVGDIDREQALVAGRTATRQYAKRQYTWFRHQPPPEWPRFTDSLKELDPALRLLDGL